MSKAVERALISVSDKTGIVDFARALADRGVELLSTCLLYTSPSPRDS